MRRLKIFILPPLTPSQGSLCHGTSLAIFLSAPRATSNGKCLPRSWTVIAYCGQRDVKASVTALERHAFPTRDSSTTARIIIFGQKV